VEIRIALLTDVEVNQLQGDVIGAGLLHNYILRLDVAVADELGVQVGHSLKKLLSNLLYFLCVDLSLFARNKGLELFAQCQLHDQISPRL